MIFHRLAGAVLTLIVLTAIAIAVFISVRFESVGLHNQLIQLLAELASDEERMNADVLGVVSLRLIHYDTLVEKARRLEGDLTRLSNVVGLGVVGGARAGAGADDAAILAQTERYRALMLGKIEFLERLKGNAALLRNEIAYIPFAVDEAATASQDVARVVWLYRLSQELLLVQAQASTAAARALEDRLAPTAGAATSMAVGAGAGASGVLHHMRTFLEQRRQLDAAMADYFAIDSQGELDRLRGLLLERQSEGEARVRLLSLVLAAAAGLLFAGLAVTIAGLRKAQLAAERASDRLSDAVENIDGAFVLFDADQRLVLCNRRLAEFYPPLARILEPGLSYQRMLEALAGSDFVRRIADPAAWVRDGVARFGEASSTTQELADTRWLLCNDRPMSHGGMVCIRIDISAQKRADHRLRLLTKAVEQSPAAIIITDLAGRIQYVNPRFCVVTGFSEEETIGARPSILKSGHLSDEFYREMWTTIAGGSEWRGVFQNRKKNGDLYWESASISPIRDEGGRISSYVAVKEDITHRRDYEEKLVRQANYDALTGMPNRVLVRDRLAQAIALAHREKTLTALLFIDLDRFKNVNDTLGHAVGDLLLKQAAERLTGCIRESDTVARMGGDEFLIILPSITESTVARRAAERVIEALNHPFRLEGQELFVTATIGIALFPLDGEEPEDLLRNADLAMYKAKEMGRNGFQFFTPEINLRAQQRLVLENQLRHAVVRGEFRLHYQPIMDLRLDRPIGVEALLRWRQDDGSLFMPADFIGVAEEIRLIQAIGDWVVGAACLEMETAFVPVIPHLRLAVNVSPRQLQVPEFSGHVRRILEEHRMPPERLELEITESVLIDDTPTTVANIKALCDLGVRLAIDDFGTGFSSLGYLQRYPFTTVKIDRSFVATMLDGDAGARLVETIITMAHGLGMEVVAEGVETPEQLAFLQVRDCDMVQGYIFSRPLASDVMAGVLARLAAGKTPAARALAEGVPAG